MSPGAGVLEAYATLADHPVARRVRTAGVWSDRRSLGGRTYPAPAAARAPGLRASAAVPAGQGPMSSVAPAADPAGFE